MGRVLNVWPPFLWTHYSSGERENGASQSHKLLVILELMAVVPKLCFVDFFIYPKACERLQENYANVAVYVCCFLRYLIVWKQLYLNDKVFGFHYCSKHTFMPRSEHNLSAPQRLTGRCCLGRDLVVFSESFVVTEVNVCCSGIVGTWCV